MGRKDGQLRVIMMDIEELIWENHLLRKIETNIKFDFIYQKAESYYSSKGRLSIDPVDYCSVREQHNNAMKKGFSYCADTDTFICEQAKQLRFTII